MINTSEKLKYWFLLAFFISSFTSAKSGLNKFTDLIFVEEWLIEKSVDLTTNESKCRASIPSHANWFGARVRLGANNELIKPIWISLKEDQFNNSKLVKVRKILDECRSGFLFLPNNL